MPAPRSRPRQVTAWLVGAAAALVLAGTGAAPPGTTPASTAPAGTAPAGAIARFAFPATSTAWAPRLVIQYLPATDRSQFGAVLVEAGRTWFFGGSNVSGHGTHLPEVVFRGGGTWHFPPLPPGLGSWIVAASADSPADIWAVTYLGGSVLRWDGSAWRKVPAGGWGASAQFTGILALGPRDVWLLGARGLHPGAGTWHWTGRGWTRAQGAATGIYQASAASAADIWGIGGPGRSRTALVHFDGARWHHIRPAALAGFRYSHVLALGHRNVWVAGSVAGRPELGHYDGRGWKALAMPGRAAAAGMCRDGRGGLWVIANSGKRPSFVRRRSAAGRWSTAKVSSNPANEVLACAWVPGTTTAWGAGRAAPLPGARGTAAAAYRTG